MKKPTLPLLRTILIGLSLVFLVFLIFPANKTNADFSETKEDLIELSDIKYGVFNVDTWKELLLQVITKKISYFEFTPEHKAEFKKRIESFLREEIANYKKRFEESNDGFFGKFKNVFASFLGVFDELEKQVPVITDEILEFIDKTENKEYLKNLLEDEIEEYAQETFAQIDYSRRKEIVEKYEQNDIQSTVLFLNTKVEELEKSMENIKYSLLIWGIVVGLLMFFPWKVLPTKLDLILLTIACFFCLIFGLYLPMIEIDARISQFDFVLLGEEVSFKNQVIYYNSRSILGVVKVLFNEKSFDIVLVGVLIFMFSVLFPISKLVATTSLITRPSLKSKKFIQFLVYKTGKWSMADVMVVAIFMSYIGFTGIVSGQLGELEKISQNIDILTTNHSNLQLGFYAFTLFVVLSLLLTTQLKNYSEKPENHSQLGQL